MPDDLRHPRGDAAGIVPAPAVDLLGRGGVRGPVREQAPGFSVARRAEHVKRREIERAFALPLRDARVEEAVQRVSDRRRVGADGAQALEVFGGDAGVHQQQVSLGRDGEANASSPQQARHQRTLPHVEARVVAADDGGAREHRVAREEGGVLLGLHRRVSERARLDEARVGEAAELAHAHEVVVAHENLHLVRRVRGEPRENERAVSRGFLAIVGAAPVEVVAHRDQPHLRAQAAGVAQQAVEVENAQELLERRLGISDGDMKGPRHAIRWAQGQRVGVVLGAQLGDDDTTIERH